MADLDFALLAEFARVDPAGLLTLVGGGFDRVQASGPGLVQQMFVVMRVHLAEDERTVGFEVRVAPPGEEPFKIRVSGVASANPQEVSPSGRHAVVTVVGLGIPINTQGRYVVQVFIAGSLVRELPFAVDFMASTAS